ncbi:MAG TPA: pyridoxal phosphate-dependent aminotransferase family protein [Epsilonproteobacteria bacterium]|nr:pyridoxal phosphate-dependent aminotransferase family protein [Campylobacterota bacterium]
MYKNELNALHRAGRFRERRLFDEDLEDMASNDYLGLSNNKKQFNKAVKLVKKYHTLTSKASMLVNGYHPIHKKFEETMAKQNGFEEGLIVGSGYLANMALIEALVRKGDMLFMDEEYHASGVMAAELLGERVVKFRHNDVDDLRQKLEFYPGKRQIIVVEGVYSMGGDLCTKEIFDLADEKKALMIVDEAHSSGVLGKKLLGIFEHYDIAINERHIKMGTLGKAYGSYGAYILASSHIISFLVNRGKPIIYSTAPSVFDTALALVNLKHIQKHAKKYRKKIDKRQAIASHMLKKTCESLIVPIEMPDNLSTQSMQQELIEYGYLVGAIRQPTVEKPIMRFILNVRVSQQKIIHALAVMRENSIQ